MAECAVSARMASPQRQQSDHICRAVRREMGTDMSPEAKQFLPGAAEHSSYAVELSLENLLGPQANQRDMGGAETKGKKTRDIIEELDTDRLIKAYAKEEVRQEGGSKTCRMY